LRARIDGDVLRHYGDTDTSEIDAPRVTAHASDGRVTHASADRALANGDASEVQLLGNARVTSESPGSGEPPLQFRGEFLHAFLRTEQLRSHLPATLTQGATEIHGDALRYDNVERVVQLDGHVRARFGGTASVAGRTARAAR
jgi:lipopolysaccharide export system protein LptC